MAIKITSVKEAIQDNGLKALVHAPAGTGKTVLCATALAPTLIISAEGGLLSLNQEVTKLRNTGSPDFDPSYCSVAEVKSLDDLEEIYNMLEMQAKSKDGAQFSWIAVDSATEIAEQVLAFELGQSKDPRKAYGNLQNKMLSILKAFRDLPQYNVIMTSKQQKQTDDTSSLTMYMPMMPGAKLHQQIPYLFDEVWCLRIGIDEDDEGKKETFHYIQAVRDMQFEAKDRSGKLTDCEPPSLFRLHAKIYGAEPDETDGSCEHGVPDNRHCEKCDPAKPEAQEEIPEETETE